MVNEVDHPCKEWRNNITIGDIDMFQDQALKLAIYLGLFLGQETHHIVKQIMVARYKNRMFHGNNKTKQC